MIETEIRSPLANGVVVLLQNMKLDDVSSSGFSLLSSLQSATDQRKLNWYGGRFALERALSRGSVSLNKENAKFIDNQTIEQLPDYRFSISHTETEAGCWLVKDPAQKTRIGFDLERPGRPLSEKLAARLRSPTDIPLNDIALWSVKEAIYKCLNEETQTGLSFQRIEALEAGVFRIAGTRISGSYQTIIERKLVSSFAWRSF